MLYLAGLAVTRVRLQALTLLGLMVGQQPPGAALRSSDEPGEPSQLLFRDDSTINVVLGISNSQNTEENSKQ